VHRLRDPEKRLRPGPDGAKDQVDPHADADRGDGPADEEERTRYERAHATSAVQLRWKDSRHISPRIISDRSEGPSPTSGRAP
jgi:hypothetical protein